MSAASAVSDDGREGLCRRTTIGLMKLACPRAPSSVVPRAPSPVGRCSTSMKTRASYLIYSGLTQSTCEGHEALNYDGRKIRMKF
jgi:hypothetical protein